MNYQTIFHVLPNAYLVVDPDLKVLDANSACLSNVDMKRDEVIGLDLLHLLRQKVAPASVSRLAASYDAVLASKARVILPLLRHASGRITAEGQAIADRYWTVTHVPVLDDSESVRCIVTHMVEIATNHLASSKETVATRDAIRHAPHPESARTVIADEIKLTRNEPPHPQLSASSSRLRVLLVEDNEDLKATTAIMIEALGHTVVAVDDAEQALNILATDSFDVLFTDLLLPKATGAELAREGLLLHPAMRVIITSGYGRTMDNARNLDAVFLPKPYQLPDIQIALDASSDLDK